MTSILTTSVQRSNVVVSSAGDLLLTVWHLPGSIDDLRQVHEEQRKLARATGKITILTIVHDAAAERLSSEMRQLIDAQALETEEWATASALVLLTQGLRASIIRGVVASLMLLRRVPLPTKVFGTTNEAFTWIAPYTRSNGRPFTLSELERCYAEMPAPSKTATA